MRSAEDSDETVPIEESDDKSGKAGSVETEITGEAAESFGTQENATQIKVKVGQRIQGVHKINGELQCGWILSRAGKANAKYKDCYNIKWDSDGSESCVDMRRFQGHSGDS